MGTLAFLLLAVPGINATVKAPKTGPCTRPAWPPCKEGIKADSSGLVPRLRPNLIGVYAGLVPTGQ